MALRLGIAVIIFDMLESDIFENLIDQCFIQNNNLLSNLNKNPPP